jgi:hypothetical protein
MGFYTGLENQEYGRRDPSSWPRDTLYLQKLTLTSLTSCGGSVRVVRSRTQATEFSFLVGFYTVVAKWTSVFNKPRGK